VVTALATDLDGSGFIYSLHVLEIYQNLYYFTQQVIGASSEGEGEEEE